MKETHAWISAFIEKNNRKPRILHVGNINNNAYQTAKMLNAQGADCDVLCSDYYHIMGNPEWDDADFDGDVGNQFFPALHTLDMHGFERPRWFAQAPRTLAIEYLIAKRENNTQKQNRLWHKMEKSRIRLVNNNKDEESRQKAEAFERLQFKFRMFWVFVMTAFKELFTKPDIFFLRCKSKLTALTGAEKDKLNLQDDTLPVIQRMLADAKAFYPDREFSFGTIARDHIRAAKEYLPLFSCYDLVQCYAIDPIWPYLCGYENYVAYEHGTLRDTVYEDNDLSRMSLLAYAKAKVVYVTNVDCYDSAVYITTHSKAPIVCGLHGFDTERMMQRWEKALQSAPAFDRSTYANDDEVLFFCPARVDIDPHYGTYLKANDMLYKALARLYKENGGGFKVLQLQWGNDCEIFKTFIRDECGEMEKAVMWHPPFGKAEYYQILTASAAVFDNLLLRLMGGNGIETMMNGHAALINKHIPQELMLRFFPKMWPIFSIENEDDIYNAAKTILQDPASAVKLAEKGREWILAYHSHACIVEKNCQSYNIIYPLV